MTRNSEQGCLHGKTVFQIDGIIILVFPIVTIDLSHLTPYSHSLPLVLQDSSSNNYTTSVQQKTLWFEKTHGIKRVFNALTKWYISDIVHHKTTVLNV